MTHASKVLELLYERREGFFSTDELARAVGCGCPAVADALGQIRQAGHAMEFSPTDGVRLVRPVRLDTRLIERGLGAGRIGQSVICFDEVDSTNDVAAEAARQGDTDGLVVVAEWQRRGRGRQGRQWLSPPGANVLMSVLLTDPAGELPHEAITIAAGLAVAEGIETACGGLVACELKWPNDVLIEHHKVAGVLVELRRRNGLSSVIVGIGINVGASPGPSETDLPATHLAAHGGTDVERVEVIRAVLRRLDAWTAHMAGGELAALHDAWVSRCGMINQRVTVVSDGVRHVGRVLDVSPLDGLILCCDHGERVHVSADRTSLAH